METIVALQEPRSLFRSGYSLSIRIWHWLTFLTITASILMVLLASTMFTMKNNIPVVQELVQQKGGSVTTQQARAVAHEFNDYLWMTHKYIGFGLCFLLLCRIIIEIVYSKEKRLSSKIRKALAFQPQNDVEKKDRQHYIWVKWGYVIFYILLLIMGVTGLVMAFEDVPFFRSINETCSGIHEFVQYLVYAYILFHIAGVIRADLTNNKGIVSRMINGSST